MTYRRTYDPANRDEVLATLRREILAARLKVTLDAQLGRRTPPKVKLLSEMKLPPAVRSRRAAGVPSMSQTRQMASQ
jgi:hypothetical protein